jgi:hypothetical protein
LVPNRGQIRSSQLQIAFNRIPQHKERKNACYPPAGRPRSPAQSYRASPLRLGSISPMRASALDLNCGREALRCTSLLHACMLRYPAARRCSTQRERPAAVHRAADVAGTAQYPSWYSHELYETADMGHTPSGGVYMTILLSLSFGMGLFCVVVASLGSYVRRTALAEARQAAATEGIEFLAGAKGSFVGPGSFMSFAPLEIRMPRLADFSVPASLETASLLARFALEPVPPGWKT